MKIRIFTVMVVSLLITACGNEGSDVSLGRTAVAADGRGVNAPVTQGERLFQQYCAECHGSEAQGAVNWRQRDSEGMFPPPPLNGTGHAWHHPREVLHDVIADGSPAGMGKMPAWRGRLSDEEIESIISWFQSRWPDEVYAAWQEMDRRSRDGS